MDVQKVMHPFNCQQEVKMTKDLSQELIQQKRKFKSYIQDKDRWRNDHSTKQVYIISTKFLNQWKKFTNFQFINASPEDGISPNTKNQNIIKESYNFGECLLKKEIQENQDYIIVAKEVSDIFQKYNGSNITRKVFYINGGAQVELYPIQVDVIFMSFNWFNICYWNSMVKIPLYEVLVYKKETIFEFGKRLAKYSQEDKRNKQYQQFRVWRCRKIIDLDKYAAQLKQVIKIKQHDENNNPYMDSEGDLLEKNLLFQDLNSKAPLFIIELRDKQKNCWVYRQTKIGNSAHASAQTTYPQKPKFAKQKQAQSIQIATPKQQLKQCKHCKQMKIALPLKCNDCQMANYCSAACLDANKHFHYPICPKRSEQQVKIKKENDIPAPPNKQNTIMGRPWGNNYKVDTKYEDQKITFNIQNGSKKGVVGLSNIGNTCYMNSALQCLSHSTDLTDYFIKKYYEKQINLKNPIGSQGKVVTQYARLLQSLWAGTYSKYKPQQFKDAIGIANPMFQGYMQHDSQQFLAFLLDTIHEDLNRVEKKPPTQPVDSQGKSDQIVGRESWFNHLRRNQSIVTDLFAGQFKSRVTCPNCNLHSLTFDPYFCIPLPLPEEGVEQITLFFFPKDFQQQTKKIIIKCLTNSVKQVFAAVEKVTNVPFSRFKVIVSGFNGMVRQVSPQDTVKRLVNQKHLSQLAEEKQLFVCEFDQKQLQAQKKFLTFKFMNGNQKAITFKRMFPFFVNDKLIGSILYDRLSRFIYRVWHSTITEQSLRQKTRKGNGFRIFIRYGGMKVEKNMVLFKNQVEVCQDTPIQKYYKISQGQMEFQVRFDHSAKMKFNSFITHKQDDHNPKFQMKTKFTIDECLKHFALTQILQEGNEWFCPSCKQFVIAEKQMQIYKAPKYLIFQIKRFKQKMHEKVKSNAKVEYPLELDMSPYVMSKTLPETYYIKAQQTEFIVIPQYYKDRKINDNQNCKYELYGVVNHYGSLQGGHYISKAKNNGSWYKFNDDSVSSLSLDQIVEAQAYLLFYKRID